MSERRDVHKRALIGFTKATGLMSAMFILGGGLDGRVAEAASMYHSVSTLALSKRHLAQTAEQNPPAPAGPAGVDGNGQVNEDIPFSELNEALSAARSRLTELTKAAEIAKVASELRERLQATEAENRQLKSVVDQLQASFSSAQSEKQAADAQVQTLQTVSEEAAGEAKRLDEELVAMRWQNTQLSDSLSQAETAAQESVEELVRVRRELTARAEGFASAADESAGEITRLQRDLDEAQALILTTESQQAEKTTELVELRRIIEETTEDSSRLAKDLDGTITELATTRSALIEAEDALQESNIGRQSADQETSVLREQLASHRLENDDLKTQLQSAVTELERFRTLNAGLEQQVSILKTAAGEATDAARQNLLAVEDQINEINAALASVKGEDLLPEALSTPAPVSASNGVEIDAQVPDDTVQAAAENGLPGDWVPRPSPPRAAVQRELITVAASEAVSAPVSPPSTPPAIATGGRVSAVADETGGPPPAAINLASLISDLPLDRRQDAEVLLSELNAQEGDLGLTMTVPGELLFAVDSEQIETAAFDPLSNVATLVNLYDQRDVLIVGHTDAVGDASYNQRLSERRAALVKKFFVENFQISAERLQIEGKGEQEPIGSNATADGRNANRRVEVVILE